MVRRQSQVQQTYTRRGTYKAHLFQSHSTLLRISCCPWWVQYRVWWCFAKFISRRPTAYTYNRPVKSFGTPSHASWAFWSVDLPACPADRYGLYNMYMYRTRVVAYSRPMFSVAPLLSCRLWRLLASTIPRLLFRLDGGQLTGRFLYCTRELGRSVGWLVVYWFN